VSEVIWQEAASPLATHRGGKCITMCRHISPPPQKLPFCVGSGPASNTWLLWSLAHVNRPTNGISIGSAVFAGLTYVLNTHTQTNRPCYVRRCDVCSNIRPRLCTACVRCSLCMSFIAAAQICFMISGALQTCLCMFVCLLL